MAEFKPAFKKSKSGIEVIIRSARHSDAQALLDLAMATVVEDAFQLLTPSELELTIESEEAWIGSYSLSLYSLNLVAEVNGILVGQLDFCNGQRHRLAHTGEFGMSVAKPHRQQGIGSILVEALIKWATSSDTIEKLGLNVHSTNVAAIGLYKKMGFEVEGLKKRELKYEDGQYVDVSIMGRFV